jgi:hypothetical protein
MLLPSLFSIAILAFLIVPGAANLPSNLRDKGMQGDDAIIDYPHFPFDPHIECKEYGNPIRFERE